MRRILMALFCVLTTFAMCACSFTSPFSVPVQPGPVTPNEEDVSDIVPANVSDVKSVNTITYSLLTDDQKAIYDALVNCYTNFDSQVEITGLEEDIETAHHAIIADRPEIFYVNGYVTDASTGAIIDAAKEYTVYPNYTHTKEEYDDLMAQVNSVADGWCKNLSTSATDYEKSKYVFDTIIDQAKYKTDAAYNQNMLSVFIYGQTVCGGYSQSFSYLMQKLGIPCAMITGELSGTAHSWNVCILDNEFYLTDLTNGDSYYEVNGEKYDYYDYSYLNINPGFIPEYGVTDLFKRIQVSAKEDNYYYKEGLHIETFSDEQIDAGIQKAVDAGMPYVTLRFDEKPLEQAKQKLLNLQEMQDKFGVTHVKTSDVFNTVTLYFNMPTENQLKAEEIIAKQKAEKEGVLDENTSN